MKTKVLFYLFTIILMSMVCVKAFAYDIAAKNEDGITLYYNYINEGKELEVTNGSSIQAGVVRIPESVTYMNRTRKVTGISASAFSGNSYITSVVIPSGVTAIKYQSFRNCTYLTNIDIPDNVIDIGAAAFYGCTSLTSVSLGSGVKRIGIEHDNEVYYVGAFNKCRKLQKVIIKDLAAYCMIEMGDQLDSPFLYGAKLYVDNDTEITNLEILGGATAIGSYVFAGCPITSVTMHDKVEQIGKGTFWGCNSLLSVNIGNGVKSIGREAFRSCTVLSEITIGSGVESIEEYAFISSGIQSIVIPDNVQKIGVGALKECTNLQTAKLGNGITEIPGSLLYKCSKLEEVSLGNAVTVIGEYVFNQCSSLKSIAIPVSITEIGESAFEDCSSLTTVSISENGVLREIGYKAFYNSGITSIVIPPKVTEIESYALYTISLSEIKSYLDEPITISKDVFSKNTIYNASLYVPKGTIDKYKAKDVWKDFVWIEEGDYTTGIRPMQSEGACKSFLYSIDGKGADGQAKEIRIIKYSNGTTKKFLVK